MLVSREGSVCMYTLCVQAASFSGHSSAPVTAAPALYAASTREEMHVKEPDRKKPPTSLRATKGFSLS